MFAILMIPHFRDFIFAQDISKLDKCLRREVVYLTSYPLAALDCFSLFRPLRIIKYA